MTKSWIEFERSLSLQRRDIFLWALFVDSFWTHEIEQRNISKEKQRQRWERFPIVRRKWLKIGRRFIQKDTILDSHMARSFCGKIVLEKSWKIKYSDDRRITKKNAAQPSMAGSKWKKTEINGGCSFYLKFFFDLKQESVFWKSS